MEAYRVTYRAFSIDGFDCWEAERGLYLRKETAEKVAEGLECGQVKEVEINED